MDVNNVLKGDIQKVHVSKNFASVMSDVYLLLYSSAGSFRFKGNHTTQINMYDLYANCWMHSIVHRRQSGIQEKCSLKKATVDSHLCYHN